MLRHPEPKVLILRDGIVLFNPVVAKFMLQDGQMVPVFYNVPRAMPVLPPVSKGEAECALKQTRKVSWSPNKQQAFSKDCVCPLERRPTHHLDINEVLMPSKNLAQEQPPANTPQHFASQEALPEHQPSTDPSAKRADQTIQLLFRQLAM